MTFDKDIHGAEEMDPDGFDDPLIFPLVPPAFFIYPVKHINIYSMDLYKVL